MVLYVLMLGGRAISKQDEIADKSEIARPKRRWWAWCLWIFLCLCLVLLALGCWGWTQRYSLMENWVVDKLAESGFEANLEIMSVSRTEAHVKNIRLRRGTQDVLAIETFRAEYVWPDIRSGQAKRFELEGLTGELSLNEDWRPDGWMSDLLPDGSNSDAQGTPTFPIDGVKLKDAELKLSSPLGDAVLYIDADIPNEEAFSSEITLAPSALSYGGYAAKGAGFVTLEKAGDSLRVMGQTQTETLANQNLSITKAYLQFDGTLNLESKSYTGSISLEGDTLESELFASGPAQLAWDGEIIPRSGLQANGTWTVKAKDARSPRPARASEVAEKLSLAPALMNVPVTVHYAPHLKETVLEFLSGSDVKGVGHLSYSPDGITVNPVGEFNVKSSGNEIRLRARKGEDFYSFDKTTEMITAQMDAGFENPVGLTLTEIKLQAASSNGLSLNGVQNFSAQLTTNADWQVEDTEGRPVRLGPLKARFQYDAAQNPRRLSVDTALDYDGDLPGGYVEGLTLDGRLDARLYQSRQELGFTPKPKSYVEIKSLETPTEWKGEDIRFAPRPATQFFTRTAKESILTADLNAADFTLTHPATQEAAAQRLDLSAANMTLNGTIFADSTQNWDIEFGDVTYASETLPSPGTTGKAPSATLTAQLAPNQPPKLSVQSPSIIAETPQARLAGVGIRLIGTPDAYSIEHEGGTISLIGSEFAETAKTAGLGSFPAKGTLEFENDAFSGRANLNVAIANDAKVVVDYTYARGAGTMDIDVPSILFDPQGLQPQNLVPAFSGKIARVNGEARAALRISFDDGVITASEGTLQLIDLGVGTAPGPITGLNSTMHFTSLLPLVTSGQQTLTMDSFNPGFPLENGALTFDFVPDGVRVDAADWPIGNGSFSLDPFTWVYAAEENRVTMRVKNVALGDFINDLGNKKVQATGTVVGNFPIVVRGIEVLIEDGSLSVPDGGTIKYDPGPNSQSYTENEAIAILRQRRSNEYATLAQDALREFKYRELSASLNGPLNGDVEIGLIFDGSNEKVLNQQPFRFDITVKGELFNIARSFNTNAHVKAEIIRQNGALPEGAVIGE